MQFLLPLAFALALPVDDPVRLRAEGPPALVRLLERWDGLAACPGKDALERTIDAVAAERYATFTRLYWYTDLPAAEAAARASGKPILSLRMLGRLDEDLSCANSRLFRVVLHANEDVAAFLRENFVLHWSSERPAPRVTIDFGDGRRIETTISGNSAHFVLDADGRPIDVLPGLYSPVAFRRELEAALPLARLSPALSDADRRERLAAYHRERMESVSRVFGDGAPVRAFPVPTHEGLLEAEQLTVGKAMVEIPHVFRAGLAALEGSGRGVVSTSTGSLYVRRLEEARLDARSRELVAHLRPIDWENDPKPLDAEGLAAEIAILEACVAADTERNETRLRSRIHGWFVDGSASPDFLELSARIYREIFLTPAQDTWLGFSTPLVFTGLPGDGVVK